MYKECFLLMDIDKDGSINKADLRGAFDNVGKLMDEEELDEMLGEVGGACNFDGMIKMFQEKMAGGEFESSALFSRPQYFPLSDFFSHLARCFARALFCAEDAFLFCEVDADEAPKFIAQQQA
jgi:hypothetical protein